MADRPIRIQLSRAKGWRMPPNTVKVDRTTKWGNPFKVGDTIHGIKVVDKRHAFCLYRGFAPENPALVAAARRELAGKNLACWCPVFPYSDRDGCCHADVLLELANEEQVQP